MPTMRSTARRSPGSSRQTRFHIGGAARLRQPAGGRLRRVVAARPSRRLRRSHRPSRGTIIGKSPLFCWRPADMDRPRTARRRRHTVASTHYWVDDRARPAASRRSSQQAYTERAVLRALEAAWSTRARSTTGRSSRPAPSGAAPTSRIAGTRAASSGSPTLPARVGAADADRAGRRGGRLGRRRRSGGRRCPSRSGTTRSRSRRTTRSARSSSRRTTDATAYSANADLPGRRDHLLARAGEQRRRQGPRLVRDVELRADAARPDDHDGRRRSRARRSPRSPGRRSTAPRATRCRTSGPTRACT